MTPNESPAALLPTLDELTNRLAHDDPVFAAWRDSVPDKHWVKLDLSALRIGYELGRAFNKIPVRRNPKYDGPRAMFGLTQKEIDNRLLFASTAPGASESRGSVPMWKGRMNDLVSAVNGAITDYADACRANAKDGSTSRTARAVDDAIRKLRDEIAAAPTPPAVANGEPTAEHWKTAVYQWALREQQGFILGPAWVEQRARELARSAAAKGEG